MVEFKVDGSSEWGVLGNVDGKEYFLGNIHPSMGNGKFNLVPILDKIFQLGRQYQAKRIRDAINHSNGEE